MEEKKCTKVKFLTQKYADFHIVKNEYRNIKTGKKARSYKCKICQNSWHITSKIENFKLVEDNEFLFNKVEAFRKTNQSLSDANNKLINKERKELREEVVILHLENLVSKKSEDIIGMSKRINDLNTFNEALLRRIDSLEEEKQKTTTS